MQEGAELHLLEFFARDAEFRSDAPGIMADAFRVPARAAIFAIQFGRHFFREKTDGLYGARFLERVAEKNSLSEYHPDVTEARES